MNSKDGINFSPAAQKCIACLSDQYIIDSNNPRFECQICPVGAVCDGSTLQGLVEGSVWTKDFLTGTYLLRSCPKVSQVMRLERTKGCFFVEIKHFVLIYPGISIRQLDTRGIFCFISAMHRML